MNGFLRKHYHWAIAFVVLIELAVYSGILNNIISLHLIPVTQELQISRGDFSTALTLRPLVGFFSTLFSGALFLKFGYRKLASLALLVAAGGFALLGWSQNFFMLAMGSAIIGLSEGFCTTAAASRVVNTWFHSHQGLILGLVTASTGLGGSLFCAVLSGIIEQSSWRSSYLLSSVLIVALAAVIFLISRDRPGQLGLLPFGSGGHHGKKPKKEHRDHWFGYEAKDVTRKPTFFLMIVVTFFSCVCCYIAFTVVVAHLQDCGMSVADAAAMQSIMLLAMAAAKFICGALSDWIGAKSVTMLCMVCAAVGLFLLAEPASYGVALAAVVIYSVCLPLTTITVPLLSSSLFGYHCQGSIIGIFMALIPASSVLTNPIVNMIYDRIGSYAPIFYAGAVLAVAVMLLAVVLYILAEKDRQRHEAIHPAHPQTVEAL